MGNFTVDLLDHNRNPVTTALQLRPVRYRAVARGGYDRAEIAVAGDASALWDVLGWLGYHVQIRNEQGTVVWAGMVVDATVAHGLLSVGLSLERMANRIRVAYTKELPSGRSERQNTDWAENVESVARYGQKEHKVSDGDTTQAKAEATRDTELGKRAAPTKTISLDSDGAAPGASLICAGLWQSLDWRYYEDLSGVIRHEENGDIEHLLGWALTAGEIGFRESRIHDINARLGHLLANNQVVVAGSSYNNGTYTITGAGEGASKSYTAATITFQSADDILDSAAGLGIFEAGEMISIVGSGAPGNNGYRWVKTTGTSRIEVTPANIVNDTPPGNVTLGQGHSAPVEQTVVQEGAGASVTLTVRGTRLAQSFVAPTPGWLLREIAVQARRLGEPTDSLRIGLYSDSGGSPGTLLENATVAGSEISTTTDWVQVQLANGIQLSAGATYWIVVDRTGAATWEHAYAVAMDGELGFTGGSCKVWDGSSWQTRAPNADMLFQIWGHRDTAEIVEDIVQAAGQFIAGVLREASSGVLERFYREGDATALDEATRLLDGGASNGSRLIAQLTPDRVVRVLTATDDGVLNPQLDRDGRLRGPLGDPWPEGALPVGRWVNLADIPVHIGELASVSPIFVEEAEYDCERGEMRIIPQNDSLEDSL